MSKCLAKAASAKGLQSVVMEGFTGAPALMSSCAISLLSERIAVRSASDSLPFLLSIPFRARNSRTFSTHPRWAARFKESVWAQSSARVGGVQCCWAAPAFASIGASERGARSKSRMLSTINSAAAPPWWP